jgi:hypothetical protein
VNNRNQGEPHQARDQESAAEIHDRLDHEGNLTAAELRSRSKGPPGAGA